MTAKHTGIRFAGPHPFTTEQEAQENIRLIAAALRGGLGNSDAILLETLGGSRSTAHVFKASALASDTAPVVVKVGHLGAEATNYARFVRPYVPARYRPEVIGHATAQDRAALCYSWLGGTTLTDHLAAGNLTALDLVAPALVDDLARCWDDPFPTKTGSDLACYYLHRYFVTARSAHQAEATLFAHAARHFGAERCAGGYRIAGSIFPSVCDTLFAGRDPRPYAIRILHGDLHSDNIIIDLDRMVANLCDFARTGPGHALQDLATLEASLRINWPPDAPIGDIWEMERLIALDDPQARSNALAKGIARIRAIGVRRAERPANYSFAVAAVALRLMKATDLSVTAEARISASLFWALKALTSLATLVGQRGA